MVRVIVVGAGVIGAAVAWRLRSRGVHVTLTDPEPGSGATRAAAGMLAAISEVQYGQDLLYPLMQRSADEYPSFLAELAAATRFPTGYDTAGTLVAAADRADRDALAGLAAVQERHGMTVHELTGREARRLEPALGPGVAAAFHIPDDHQVDPRLLVRALLDAALRDDADGPGASLVRRRVRAVEPGVPAAVVLDDGTRLTADVVVVAPGSGVAAIEGLDFTVPHRDVYGDVIRLRVPDSLIASGESNLLTHTVRGLVHGRPVYLVPRDDGRLVLGATSREDGRPGVDAGGVFRLLRDAAELVPAVLDTEITETLARARPGTPDDIPLIGAVAPGVILSCGYHRHGILLAPLGSRITADVVCGTESPDDPHRQTIDPLRFASSWAARTEGVTP